MHRSLSPLHNPEFFASAYSAALTMELFLSRMLIGLVIPFQVALNTELSTVKVRGGKSGINSTHQCDDESLNHREVSKSLDENPIHPNVIEEPKLCCWSWHGGSQQEHSCVQRGRQVTLRILGSLDSSLLAQRKMSQRSGVLVRASSLGQGCRSLERDQRESACLYD